MSRWGASARASVGVAVLCALAGCYNGIDPTAAATNVTSPGDEFGGDDGADDDDGNDEGIPEPDCDLQAVFAHEDNGCTNAGCHGVQHAAGLDLASPDLGPRLVGRASATQACAGRLIVDPEAPDRSLLLTQVTPEGVADGCGVIMPLDSDGVSEEHYSCIAQWVEHFAAEVEPPDDDALCDAFEPSSPETYVSKVKTLVTGRRATPEEVQAVSDDPDALAAMVQAWIETPEFDVQLTPLLTDLLQISWDIEDLDNKIGGVPAYQPLIETNLAESYLRTVKRIIADDRPFHEIATTTEWEVTTYTLAVLTYLDAGLDERRVDHVQVTVPPEGVSNPIPLQYSIDNAIWQVPEANEPCTQVTRRGANVLTMLAGRCQGSQNIADPVFTPSDFSDWRTVTLVPAETAEPEPVFWDVLALRAATETLAVGMPRVGFLTHPAFLSRWETNEDNQFRVTTNQALLVMTGHTFEVGDTTEPESTAGLDSAHADPESACYRCHRALDPMRVYFSNVYDYDYVGRGNDQGSATAGYAFRGVTDVGGDLYDFAERLAENPDFAAAWTAKLCHWANSQGCDEADPEFIRVAEAFAASNFSFKTLLVELLTSPLVTGAELTETYCSRPFLVSITRRDQLCHALNVRLGVEGICDDGRLAKLVELIPEDAVARGEAALLQNPVSSAFHAAGAEQFCKRLAEELVVDGGPLSPNDRAGVLAATASGLMGIAEGTARHDEVMGILNAHVDEAPTDPETALRSAFALGCMSSNVMALGL